MIINLNNVTGLWLSMMGVESKSLKPMIKPFILGMGSDVAPMVGSMLLKMII